MTTRSSFKLTPEAADDLAAAAAKAEISVSQLVGAALEDALEHGLDPGVGPLPAGERVVAGRLDDELAASFATEAERAGISLSAYTRLALAAYLATEGLDAHGGEEDDDEDQGDGEELDNDDADDDEEEVELPSPLVTGAVILLGAAALWWWSNPTRTLPA